MCPHAQLSGLHPRSEDLIELTRAYDRGQASWSDVSKLLDVETSQIVELQEKLGFEYLSDGGLGWQDPLRPLTRSLEGVTSGTRYSRWFDTNTFYQKPVVTGEVSFRSSRLDEFVRADLLPKNRKWKVALPGPYTFSELSENKHYQNKPELVLSVARAERDLIQRLGQLGVSFVQVSEPCLVYRPYREDTQSEAEIQYALKALRLVAENSLVEMAVQTFFGDATSFLPELLDLPVKAVGFDLFETDCSALQLKTSKQIILGIVDSRESHVEDAQWISDTANLVSQHVGASELAFSPNSDLKYLPRPVADAKAEALADAVRIFQETG